MKLNIIYVRVGNTRSGKMIPYSSSINDLGSIIMYFKDPDFSSDDLLDAFAVFEYLALRGKHRGDEAANFERHSDAVQEIFAPQALTEARERANIRSAFDQRDLGRSLAAVEFADF